MIQIKWKFVFKNAPEKVLVSRKRIIYILTFFITRMYSFCSIWSNIS